MKNYRKFALKHFEVNRLEAERRLAEIRRILDRHQHRWFCCSWSWCRKLERETDACLNHIAYYKKAEQGLEKGDCQPAIEVLDQLAEQLDETPKQLIRRIIGEGPAMPRSIRSAPGVLRARVKELRNGLVELSRASM